jgi:putative membrane protein
MDTTSTGQTNGTLGGSSATTGAATTLHGQDATFLQKAAQAGREEVADAQLALQNAQRSETKSVAQMMMDDHKRANDQLQQLASRKGWTMPSAGSAESDQSRNLASGGKSDFDQRYITEEIRDHRDAIATFRTEASSGSDPDLRQFARDNLPALEHHLEMLQGANSQK